MTHNTRYIRFGLCAAIGLAACGSRQGEKRAADTSAGISQASATAPDSFRVTFETSRGPIVVNIVRAWAPLGADRFLQLVQSGFFDQDRFFRVVPNFVAQFGINDKPSVNDAWDGKRISDDPVLQTNARGTLVFATEGANTRTHQLYFNLGNNQRLDRMGFAPIGRVVEGMNVLDSLYSGYGEDPDQHMIQTLGNSYLQRMFPKLDYIKTAKVTAVYRP